MTRFIKESLLDSEGATIISKLFLIENMGVANEDVTEENDGGTRGVGVVQMDVLRAVVGRLNVNKAVGIDGMPGLVIELIFEHRAQELLAMMNFIYETGRVPAKWKVAWLILLNKPGKDPRLASSYRPISILPAMSTVKSAIKKELGMNPFHRNQFGFRKGKSTIDATSQVCKFADSYRKKGITLRWEVILKEAKRRSLPSNLTRIRANYLKDRFVVLDNPSGLIAKQIFAGVPQDSVAGPLLWNLIYDGLLPRFDNRLNLRDLASCYLGGSEEEGNCGGQLESPHEDGTKMVRKFGSPDSKG